jgi:hypothetical protein
MLRIVDSTYVAWTPNRVSASAMLDLPLFDQPAIVFSPAFLGAIGAWVSRGYLLKPMWQLVPFSGSLERGQLVIGDDGSKRRIWRLTGDVDEHGGWIGVWPD